ncbi:MAG: ParB family transcriptional regulator, chromosome partitioning protein [Blastocatellia bacterium]|jgi:ParB family chromosome partitioning protein|nr:ParB family transcriptional regulator, chromosome partitioning protein [Blastocatellia bacterium]
MPGAPEANPNEELREVDIDLIQPSKHQPRTRFSDERLEELARSIQNNGVIQPILLRHTAAGFELIAGERRWLAAKKAGLARIPAIVREIPDDRVLELALVENIQRQELNPIEEASAYMRLLETLGLKQEELAERLGKERSTVTNYLRLLRLPPDLQLLVEEEKLSMGHARCLLGLEGADQQRSLARKIIERKMSVREVERAIQQTKNLGAGARMAAPPKPIDPNLKAAQDRLRRRYGTQVKIISTTKQAGKIELEYYDDKDLDRLYTILMGKSDSADSVGA